MGKGQQGQSSTQINLDDTYSWDDVKEHSSKTDKWVVIENGVYDVSKWVTRHPGGFKVLSHYAGEDATVSFLGC